MGLWSSPRSLPNGTLVDGIENRCQQTGKEVDSDHKKAVVGDVLRPTNCSEEQTADE